MRVSFLLLVAAAAVAAPLAACEFHAEAGGHDRPPATPAAPATPATSAPQAAATPTVAPTSTAPKRVVTTAGIHLTVPDGGT